MLDPKTPIALLPQDREIMEILDLSEAEYRSFCLECRRRSTLRPGEPVAFSFVTFAVTLLVGIALSAISALLAPKQQEPEEAKVDESKVDGQDIVRKDRFAAKYGFDSVQNVVTLGSVIPIVYAKRETKSGRRYGGIRVNTNLIWSQILSLGGGQFFRGIFMIGEAANVSGVDPGPIIDYDQIAIGNNTLASYFLREDQQAGRATIYNAYRSTGSNRITSQDYKLGVVAQEDIGNKSRSALGQDRRGPDVYCVENATDDPDESFCQCVIPSNQTQFGLYGFMGNRMAFKLGERFEPLTQWQARDDGEYERQDSNQKVAQNFKDRARFLIRAGFNVANADDAGERDMEVGDTFTYTIYQSSDMGVTFESDGSSSGNEQESVVNAKDVASTIGSIQRGYDERITIGDLYRAGSALAICTDRSNQPFRSEAETGVNNSGNTVTHTFEVLRRGRIEFFTDDQLTTGPGIDR